MGGGYNPINPAYFIDDTPEKQGTTFLGRPVINYEEAHELCKGYVILVCSGSPQARKIIFDGLRNDGVEDADFCGFQEYFFCAHKDKVLAVFDMLEDDFSKASYANAILTRMGKTKVRSELVTEDSYFELPAFATFDGNEVFVDCGAYVGDTIEEYVSTHIDFKKIVAFEPVDRNFCALIARVNRLKQEWNLPDSKIEMVCGGIGESSYYAGKESMIQQAEHGVHLSGIRLSHKDPSGEGGVPVYALNEYFATQPISFLKADIEGYEWKMLAGGGKVLRRDLPKLAVCIYHTPADMFRLAIQIKEICPEYKIFVRQHQLNWHDTILYAYVEKEYGIIE
ncbi:FkbM family methyltransferase [Acutalibacter sp. 1XD8-33]|uniref:FkbM family methyltransferase n=1 Tax=Acutalibacter sp. 1XD8-33 TaxID=2320081 RepID=UPI000EA3AC79|nr:FkbM family methyltransferase [Acutalibacter sp. 1XD8-33]RKJ41983.1 FkbM family methyltransferase [Acutalibacter sp. 1XD8-33]